LIESGRVLVAGSRADKPSRLVSPAEPVVVTGDPPRFVGRGGEKLAAALDRFGVDPTGLRALDVGASTGGFTDCLLQRGAAEVTALDVGRAQLHERLRHDSRVQVRERSDIRDAGFDHPFDLAVADVSFISLRLVARAVVGAVRPGGHLLILVKPQFEVGKREASRGKGVIRNPILWRSALDGAITAFNQAGASMIGAMVSPLRGADGNVEFFLHLVTTPGLDHYGAVDWAIDAASAGS
jgi:23S rRNA (cytidine1920-2'-O)/16S rRNA (cytidine1409-2'-O)-methyltransferase